MRRLRRVVRELHRKGFHFAGLIIPALYYVGLKVPLPYLGRAGLTKERAVEILGVLTTLVLALELMRFLDPEMNRFFVRRFRRILRPSETREVTGTAYYLLGAFLSVWFFPPTIAIAALLFLVFGDFAAALVGQAIGRVRLLARKTLEGSLACFLACLVVGFVLFWRTAPEASVGIRLALVGAVAATLAELLPLRVNDNLTIPLISGLALFLAARSLGVEVPFP